MQKVAASLIAVLAVALLAACSGHTTTTSSSSTQAAGGSSPAASQPSPTVAECPSTPPPGHDSGWDNAFTDGCLAVVDNVSPDGGWTAYCQEVAGNDIFASSADTPTVLSNACLDGVQAAGASVS